MPLLDGQCDTRPSSRKCVVPMTVFDTLPALSLKRGDQIVAIMTATNKYGEGIDSEPSSAVSLKLKPKKMYPPTFNEFEKTRDSVTVNWDANAVPGETVNYELLISIDEKTFERVYYGPKTSYLSSGMDAKSKYDFKVRTANICGIGETSEKILITFGNVCKQIPPVTTSRTRCDVRIDWEQPKGC